MKLHHRVTELVFSADRMNVTIDGQRYSCALAEISERLAKASAVERHRYEVSPAGYGIHWPLIDEDLSIDGLLKVAQMESTEAARQTPMRRPMAVAEGRGTYGLPGRKFIKRAR